jgi:outer membrane protein OmpA-like peptidoglycan-associated protein
MHAPLKSIAFAVLAVLSASANGDTVYVDANEVPRPIDVARALAGADFQPALRKRGLSLESDAPAQRIGGGAEGKPAVSTKPAKLAAAPAAQPAATTPAATPAPAAAPGTLAVAVAFGFASADLTPPARAQLDSIAEGLKLLKADAAVVIEGHTDSIGPDAYNLALSDRRAQSVKRYLVEQHGIAAERLSTVGKGKAEPLADTPPQAARNRRVAFRLG